MTHHSQLINYIAEKINANTYGEIGVYNPEHNFDLIKCDWKISIDPDPNAKAIFCMTSDDYFKKYTKVKRDVWFIDGLHHADQVKKDIINSWAHLNEGGVIVIHDTNPYSEHITHVPRDNREWSGDVYKAICAIADPFKFTIDFDYGCTILKKYKKDLKWFDDLLNIDFIRFDKNRNKLLNLKSIEEALQIIDSWTKIKDSEDSTNQTKEINVIS